MDTGLNIIEAAMTPAYRGYMDTVARKEAYRQAMLRECKFADEKATEFGIDISHLTLEQPAIVSAIANPSATDNVQIQAGAGTGKTTTLRAAVKLCRAEGLKVLVCASTHKAAQLLDGYTIHNIFNWESRGRGAITEKGFKTVARVSDEILNADVIIVDENSMVSLDEMDSIAATVKKAEKKTGRKIKLVTSGDAAQLGPIITNKDIMALTRRYPYIPYVVDTDDYGVEHPHFPYCWFFFADAYTDIFTHPDAPISHENRMGFRLMTLTKSMRIKDKDYLDACSKIGCGDTNGIYDINRRAKIYDQKRDIYDGRSIFLTGRRDAVEKINLDIIRQLITRRHAADPGETFYWVKTEAHYYPGHQHLANKLFKGRPAWTRYSNAPESAYAIPGMRIIMCQTVYAGSRGNKRIIAANGETGVILEHSGGRVITADDEPLEECDKPADPNNFVVTIKMDKDGRIVKLPRQRYDLSLPKYDVSIDEIGEENIGYILAMPYLPAYAMTIHRAQGSTYESVVVDPDTFAPGQLYVALTRCKGFDGLRLTRKLRPEDVMVDPYAAYYLQNPNFFPLNLAREYGLIE